MPCLFVLSSHPMNWLHPAILRPLSCAPEAQKLGAQASLGTYCRGVGPSAIYSFYNMACVTCPLKSVLRWIRMASADNIKRCPLLWVFYVHVPI